MSDMLQAITPYSLAKSPDFRWPAIRAEGLAAEPVGGMGMVTARYVPESRESFLEF
jgi:hypothetical protein